MRFPRIKPDTHSFYHFISRVVEGRFIFALHHGRSVPAEKIIAIVRALEAFSGVRLLDYVIMANHFHLVCEVPDPRPLSQNEVLERIGALYGPRRVRALRQKLARFSELLDGVILGSREFVQSHCQRLEQKIGYKRKSDRPP
jgi:REP element-mobilizing transposase RayT